MSYNKGGSKFLTGLICFLLGFILAVAAIAGVVCVGLFADLDTVFSLVGISNTDDEGNYVYVNTDGENGGADTLYDLLTAIVNYAGNYGEMTLGDLETLIPAASSLTDGLVGFVDDFVDTDYDELREGFTTTKLSELGTYVSDLVSGIKAVTLIENYAPDLMGDDAAGVIITAIVLGKEADYVTIDDSTTAPVYYDVYKPVYNSSGSVIYYTRYTADENGSYTVEDTSSVIYATDSLYDYLVPVYKETASSGDSGVTTAAHLLADSGTAEQTIDYCYLYYYTYNGATYVTDGDFTYTTAVQYSVYSEEIATLSGNYYYDNDGERVIVTSVTIGDLSDSAAITDSLNYVKLTDIMDVEDGDSLANILSGYTIGDIIDGNVDFDSVELTDVLTARPSNTAMVVILYNGVSSITQNTTTAKWTCKYTDDDGVVHDAYIYTDDDMQIEHIYYYVKEEGGEGGYAYNSETGWYDATTGGEYTQKEVPATTIGEISSVVNDLELIAFMDPVEPDDALMMYIMYGVTGAEYNDTDGWTASYKVKDASGNVLETVEVVIETYTNDEGTEVVSRVYYTDDEGEEISTATTVNGASDVLNGLQDEFEIAALLDDVETDDAILIYISYKVNGVKAVETTDTQTGETTITYVGTYTDDDGTKYEATLKTTAETVQTTVDAGTEGAIQGTNESGETYCYTESTVYYVTGAYYTDGEGNEVKIKGTTINQMTDRIDGLMDDLTLSELIGDTSDNALLDKLGSATINTLSETIDSLAIQEIYAEDIYTETVYLQVVESESVSGYDAETMIVFDASYTFYTRTGTSEDDYVYTKYDGTFSSYSDMSGTSETYYVKTTVSNELKIAVIVSINSNSQYSYYNEETSKTETVNSIDDDTMIGYDEDYLYYYYDEDTEDYVLIDYDNDGENLGKLTKEQFYAITYTDPTNYTLYTYGEASGAWKFMLYGEDREVGSITYTGEEAYSINSIAQLMNNVTSNIGTATLYELQDAGIISSETLDSPTSIYVDESDQSKGLKKVGDLTILELLDYVEELMETVSRLQS